MFKTFVFVCLFVFSRDVTKRVSRSYSNIDRQCAQRDSDSPLCFFYLLTYHIVKNTKGEERDAVWCKRNSDFSKGYYKDLMIFNTFAIKIDNHNDDVD